MKIDTFTFGGVTLKAHCPVEFVPRFINHLNFYSFSINSINLECCADSVDELLVELNFQLIRLWKQFDNLDEELDEDDLEILHQLRKQFFEIPI